jgi:hypothetical protein
MYIETRKKRKTIVQETNKHIKRKKQNFIILSGYIFIEEDEREIVACVQKQKPKRKKN